VWSFMRSGRCVSSRCSYSSCWRSSQADSSELAKRKTRHWCSVLSVRSLFTEYANEGGGAVKAVQRDSLEVPEGKLFTLLGPSGCGKTTTPRSIAGLEKPTVGENEADGRSVYPSEKG